MMHLWIDVLQLLVRIEEHAQLDVVSSGRQMPLIVFEEGTGPFGLSLKGRDF